MDYISKDELRKHLADCMTAELFDSDMKKAVVGIDVYVENMPAADVQPVKHGCWVEEEPRVLKCSVCGEYAPMNYLGQNCIDSRYCPWCGTKMDTEPDEPWQSE